MSLFLLVLREKIDYDEHMNQVAILRNMTGVKRLEQAFLLSDFVRELALKNISQHSSRKLSKKELMQKLRERINA